MIIALHVSRGDTLIVLNALTVVIAIILLYQLILMDTRVIQWLLLNLELLSMVVLIGYQQIYHRQILLNIRKKNIWKYVEQCFNKDQLSSKRTLQFPGKSTQTSLLLIWVQINGVINSKRPIMFALIQKYIQLSLFLKDILFMEKMSSFCQPKIVI